MDTHESIKDITLDDFIGQTPVIETLKISIAASKMRGEPLGHVLLMGPVGSGKTTIAYAAVCELNAGVKISHANELCRPHELAAVLTNLGDGDVLIIKDIDVIPRNCMELLCNAMTNFCLDIVVGNGTSARHVQLDLPKFTLIGITDKKRVLLERVQDCVYLSFVLNDYEKDDLIRLAENWCALNKVAVTNEASEKIAVYADGSNRKLTNTLKRARDFAQVINNGVIDLEVAEKTINNL